MMDQCGKLPGHIRSLGTCWLPAHTIPRYSFGRSKMVHGAKFTNIPHIMLQVSMCMIECLHLLTERKCQLTLLHGPPMNMAQCWLAPHQMVAYPSLPMNVRHVSILLTLKSKQRLT
jgi:hypothetical protein